MSRLLTFMYEEDQQSVLAMYSSLFDDANDERALLDFLESPTRQAVMLARAYNAKERKLQVNTSSRADALYEEEEAPAFLEALECMREEAESRGFVNEHRDFIPVSIAAEKPTPPVLPKEPEVKKELPPVLPDVPAPAPIPIRETPEKKQPETPNENTFTFESAPSKKKEKPVSVFPAEEPVKEEEKEKTVSVPLAVLYSLFAVPITIALCVLLLAPAFLSLGLCILCGVIGFKVFIAAFGSFYMFSDIMIVLGSSIIIIALGLLFLWIFVWFVGGAIAGIINGAIALGGKWCSKEVPVK